EAWRRPGTGHGRSGSVGPRRAVPADRCRRNSWRLRLLPGHLPDLCLNDVDHVSGSLSSNPARFGHVHLLIVGTAILDLVVRARAGGGGVTDIRAVCHGRGAGSVQLPAGVVYIVDHEAQMVNARIARRVPRTLPRVLAPGPEDRKVDVPVGKVHARSRLADLLEAEDVLVEGRGLFGIRSADGDVLDPGHGASLPARFSVERVACRSS